MSPYRPLGLWIEKKELTDFPRSIMSDNREAQHQALSTICVGHTQIARTLFPYAKQFFQWYFVNGYELPFVKVSFDNLFILLRLMHGADVQAR